MEMIEFANKSGHTVVLTGPNKEKIQVKKFQRVVLSSYYKRYVPRYLRTVRVLSESAKQNVKPIQPINKVKQKPKPKRSSNVKAQPALAAAAQTRLKKMQEKETRRKHLAAARQAAKVASRSRTPIKKKIVGSTNMVGNKASKYYKEMVRKLSVPVSNDIGVGILSFNRVNSLKRLVDSIRKYTDLNRTTIIISDESSNKDVHQYLSAIKDMAILRNSTRIGIAGNTNRLMRCLERFNYKIILNDDVEILTQGWENIYANAMSNTGMHHFCHRQDGVYGAKDKDCVIDTVNGYKIKTISEKPQGAVIAYNHVAFKKVGYFDENFGIYGQEHVDWSNRVSMSGIQKSGYHDVLGSDKFYKVHKEKSAVDNRSAHLKNGRKIFEKFKDNKNRIYVKPTPKSEVSGVTYIVPFRGMDRGNAIRVVLLNIKAQKYPLIEIIMAEQDEASRHNISAFSSIKHLLAKNKQRGQPFTKSLAFNHGITKATQKKLILHDADMLVQSDYTSIMSRLLDSHDGVHVGKNVLYVSKKSTEQVFRTAKISPDLGIERTVGYFEGGSLGCTYNTYLKIGGFNEGFIGYGCFGPGNYVLTQSGYKAIEQIHDQDLLYTHEGAFQPIELRCRPYNGEVIDLFVPGRLPIKNITPEHPFLIKTGDDEWQWRKVCDLKKGDQIMDTDFMPESICPYDPGLNIHNRKDSIQLSDINAAMILSGFMRAMDIPHSFEKQSTDNFNILVNDDNISQFGKIYDIRHKQYEGLVYNFEVKQDHSYIVNGLVAHNCEDTEFFSRLASSTTFFNKRSIDLVHLWHGRTTGWKTHHNRNKEIEAKIYKQPMKDRINSQYRAFYAKYGLQPK